MKRERDISDARPQKRLSSPDPTGSCATDCGCGSECGDGACGASCGGCSSCACGDNSCGCGSDRSRLK